ncbi:MAG: DUF6924 domain-containing protein [Bacteroidia bacterium]
MKRMIEMLLLISISLACVSNKYEIESLAKKLPNSTNALVVRTDYSNDSVWKSICLKIREPEKEHGFIADIDFIDDTILNNSSYYSSKDTTPNYKHSFYFIADSITTVHKDHPILCVGLQQNSGLFFRVVPSSLWAVENNLSISNMNFEDFIYASDNDGIYRAQ